MRPIVTIVGFLIVIPGLFWSCATQVPPSGGPVDKTPPRVLNVVPENKSTNVSRDQKIEFEFSEGMNHKLLQNAIFISPDPGEAIKFRWKGRKLQIRHEDSLKVNRTYVITLGTDLKDLHGNSLAQSYTLAFSTGDEISDGRISGKVYASEAVQGVLIWAYILETDLQPNPAEDIPDYVTQTNAVGNFELTNLSEGKYRLFAIKDNDNNRYYEAGLDGLGVSSLPALTLAGDSLAYPDLNFKLRKADIVGPALVSVISQNQTQIRVTFDEALSLMGIDQISHYAIPNAKQSDSLAIEQTYLDPEDKKSIVLITGKQTAGKDYILTVSGVTDVFENAVDPDFNSLSFVGSAIPDMLGPTLMATIPKDSSRRIPLDASFEVKFSEPVERPVFERNFSLIDSAVISGQMVWLSPAWAKFIPRVSLHSSTTYSVVLPADSVLDLSGNATVDSMLTFIFTTLDSDTLSSISGTLSDPDSSATGPIIMSAMQTARDGRSYTIRLEAPGSYLFDNVLPGTYIIDGFRDRDRDGKYGYGSAFPYSVAERFFVYDDSIKVRSRWPNDGNDISFRK